MIPTLLLSPAESRSRTALVTPTVSSGVEIVDGQFGSAWRGASGGVTVPRDPTWRADVGTVLVRCRLTGPVNAAPYSLYVGGGSPNRFYMGADTEDRTRIVIGGVTIREVSPSPIDYETWHVHAVRYDHGALAQFVDGTRLADATYGGTALGVTAITVAAPIGSGTPYEVESVLIYPTALPDSQIARLSTMDAAWTWQSVLPQAGGCRRIIPPDPVQVTRRVPAEPVAVRRTTPAEPVAMSRRSDP